jgi:hypothetical protein
MPVGHLQLRKTLSSYEAALSSLGGTLRYYYPLTDLGDPGLQTSEQNSGTSNLTMTAGSITNRAWGGGAYANGRVSWNDPTLTAPDGQNHIKRTRLVNDGNPLYFHQLAWSGNRGWWQCWLQCDADVQNDNTAVVQFSNGNANDITFRISTPRGNPNQIGLERVSGGTIYATENASTFLNPTHLAIVADYEAVNSSYMTHYVYINGVLKITATEEGVHTGLKGGLAACTTNYPTAVHTLTASGGGLHTTNTSIYIGGVACGTGVAPGSTEWTNIYNAYKDK